jgi:hypothetical protein
MRNKKVKLTIPQEEMELIETFLKEGYKISWTSWTGVTLEKKVNTNKKGAK